MTALEIAVSDLALHINAADGKTERFLRSETHGLKSLARQRGELMKGLTGQLQELTQELKEMLSSSDACRSCLQVNAMEHQEFLRECERFERLQKLIYRLHGSMTAKCELLPLVHIMVI